MLVSRLAVPTHDQVKLKKIRSVKPEATSLLGAPLPESDALEQILQFQSHGLSIGNHTARKHR